MKHILVNLATQEATIYTSKTDIAKHLGIGTTILWKWQKLGFKSYKHYQIYFDVNEVRATSKRRNNGF